MKVYSPEESGRIVAHENVHFSSGHYETRSSKLADENGKCRPSWIWKELQLFLVAACSKTARTSVKVRKTKRLPLVLLQAQKRISEQALHWPLVGSLRWDDRRTSITTLHVSVVWAIEHFYKNKASHRKQKQFSCCFLSLFYVLSIISAFVTNIMSFIEALFRLRICLFRYVFCRRESSKTSYFGTVGFNTTVVNNGLCEPYLLQTNSSFPLRLSESQGMFNLGQICQNSEAKIWKPTYRHQPVLCSL